jgi:hypothetical protein
VGLSLSFGERLDKVTILQTNCGHFDSGRMLLVVSWMPRGMGEVVARLENKIASVGTSRRKTGFLERLVHPMINITRKHA